MRWGEIIGGNVLLEGATIYPSRIYNAGTDNEHHGWPSELVSKTEMDCRDCEGSGEDRGEKCVYCQGTGKETEDHWDFPSLDVSYDNLRAIQDMLGLDDDSSGMIDHGDIPQMKRALIVLKNKGSEQYTKDSSVQQSRVVGQDEYGNTSIGMGARMHDMGRSHAQVERYIEKLMDILDFAQKNDMNVTWA